MKSFFFKLTPPTPNPFVEEAMTVSSSSGQHTDSDVDKLMNTIPEGSRYRWCGGEYGLCACMGCVQVCNRVVMVRAASGEQFYGDPEYILESRIPKDIYDRLKITREEWEEWKRRNNKT